MFKIFKTEFLYPNTFDSIERLKLQLFNYVNWYNNIHLHLSINYLTPLEYKINTSKKIVSFSGLLNENP